MIQNFMERIYHIEKRQRKKETQSTEQNTKYNKKSSSDTQVNI